MRTDEDNQKSVTLNIYIAFKDYSYDLGGNQHCLYLYIYSCANQCLAHQLYDN